MASKSNTFSYPLLPQDALSLAQERRLIALFYKVHATYQEAVFGRKTCSNGVNFMPSSGFYLGIGAAEIIR
jgi:membrane-anchored protein YejM (alkaline phosphatase superfamily)